MLEPSLVVLVLQEPVTQCDGFPHEIVHAVRVLQPAHCRLVIMSACCTWRAPAPDPLMEPSHCAGRQVGAAGRAEVPEPSAWPGVL